MAPAMTMEVADAIPQMMSSCIMKFFYFWMFKYLETIKTQTASSEAVC